MGSESRLSNSNESGSEKEFSLYSKLFTAVAEKIRWSESYKNLFPHTICS